MADAADIAQEQAERLQAIRDKHRASQPVIESANECQECGDLIPSDRQIAAPGCQCCAPCTALLELEARKYRGGRQ